MTRGKYAAKAANRMAQIDSEIVADLRAKLDLVTNERDEARRDARRLEIQLASEVHRAARNLADARVAGAMAELLAERTARTEDREQLGKEVFAIFDRLGFFPPFAAQAEMASLFGMAGRMGELFHDADSNRNARRMTARRARLIQAHIDAGDRQI